jgi:hypothetical protein
VVLATAAVMGAALPLLTVAFMTLIQRRTPLGIMGRVSAAVEVVMAAPQAISLAVGSLLVVVLSYRTILSIMGLVTVLAAAYITVLLRGQIASDVRSPVAATPDLVTPEAAAIDTGILPLSSLEPRPADTWMSPSSRSIRLGEEEEPDRLGGSETHSTAVGGHP